MWKTAPPHIADMSFNGFLCQHPDSYHLQYVKNFPLVPWLTNPENVLKVCRELFEQLSKNMKNCSIAMFTNLWVHSWICTKSNNLFPLPLPAFPRRTFCVLLLADKQIKKQTDAVGNMTSLVEGMIQYWLSSTSAFFSRKPNSLISLESNFS